MLVVTHYNPTLLPKIRSNDLRSGVAEFRFCTLRIASFFGQRCASHETIVAAHLGSLGKGMSTKVSDLTTAGACLTCHNIVDMADMRAWDTIIREAPREVLNRIINALAETQTQHVLAGRIIIPKSTLI